MYQEVKQGLVKHLQEMLHNQNKYIKDSRTTIDVVLQNWQKLYVVIHTDRKSAKGHRGCYNAVTSYEIAFNCWTSNWNTGYCYYIYNVVEPRIDDDE